MKKATVYKFMVVAISLCLVAMFVRNYSFENKLKNEDALETPNAIVSQEQLLEKEYEQELKVEEFERVINNDIEINLLEIKDEYVISHENVREGILGWLVNSSISINIKYTAIISIPTEALDITFEEGVLHVFCDLTQLCVKSVEIDGISAVDSYGLFAKKYSHKEVSALTLITKEYVRESIENNTMLNFMAEQNLKGYLRNQALKLYIFDIEFETSKITE